MAHEEASNAIWELRRWQVASRWLRRAFVPVFALVVVGLLLSHLHKVDWVAAWEALRRYPPSVLVGAGALALCSHALYGCFDLVGRHHIGHALSPLRSWTIAVTSYAFNLNLGSVVGGVAMRARMYTRAGVDEVTLAQIVAFSMATNWLGYGVLAGLLFAAGAITPPAGAHLDAHTLRLLGGAMLLAALVYVITCARLDGRVWHVRGRPVRLPAPRLAVVQLAVSAANWALMGAVMYVLLRGQVPYATTLGVLMAAAVVGVVTPIPAGLGVLEAVYLSLLSGSVPQGTVMGAVLAYRALYYLFPLLLAIARYGVMERGGAASTPVH